MAPDTSSRPINSFMIASLPPDGILCLKVSLDEINLLYGENSLTTKIGFWVGSERMKELRLPTALVVSRSFEAFLVSGFFGSTPFLFGIHPVIVLLLLKSKASCCPGSDTCSVRNQPYSLISPKPHLCHSRGSSHHDWYWSLLPLSFAPKRPS